MKKKKDNELFLYGSLLANIVVLVYTMGWPHKKDRIFAYLFNAITNVLIDTVLVRKNMLSYPVRLLPRLFKFNLLFDVLVYPTMTVVYNQWTSNDKSKMTMLIKVLAFSIPFTMIESWFHLKTKLIVWKNGYNWYHTFFGLTMKSLITRFALGVFRKLT